MCTLIHRPENEVLLLGMNRDEKLARVAALPPLIGPAGGRRARFPSEPGGGTWIGVNDTGVCFALINWYAIKTQVSGPSVSRGEVVRSALAADAPGAAAKILGGLPLNRVNPFRLLGFFPAGRNMIEWRWNLKALEPLRHSWEIKHWISSGFDEPGAQQSRGQTFCGRAATTIRRRPGLAAPPPSLPRTCLRALFKLYAPRGCGDRELHRSHRVRARRETALPRRATLCAGKMF